MTKQEKRVLREREKSGDPARYYRKQYLKFCNLRFLSSEFDIHHLDKNWKNNKPANLVALPKKLHEAWHRLEGRRVVGFYDGKFFICSKVLQSTSPRLLLNIIEVVAEINKWIDYRDFLLGNIGLNLHGLKYD